ncbi:hypothetical protein EMCRGX_G021553, partial [Ephydatia muelleri]
MEGGTNCSVIDPLQKLQLYVALDAVFAVVSSLACLATIVLFVVVQAHRSYVHRLTLYLAITSLFFSVSLGLSVAPIDTERYPISPRHGWNDTCIAFGFLIQYFSLSSALATLWICINVFALSVFNVTIGKRGCEVGGYIVMFLVPCLVFWIPIVSNSFGQTSVWCWIRCSSRGGDSLGASLGPILVLYLISVVMVFVVVVRFLIELKRGHVRDAHKAALKEVLPLLIYPGMYSVVFGVAAFTPLYVSYAHRNVSISIFNSIAQAIRLLLPISFLLHPSIRRKLIAMRKHSRLQKDTAKNIWQSEGCAPNAGSCSITNTVEPDKTD